MADTVRAAVQVAPRNIEIREFPRPAIGPDDGLLRVEANGICGSDVESYRGHLAMGRGPTIPGHEPMGIVEEIGDRAARAMGRATGGPGGAGGDRAVPVVPRLPDRALPGLPQPPLRPRRHRDRRAAVVCGAGSPSTST